MNREKRLTKRERKALAPPRPGARSANAEPRHIHCVACGRHIEPEELSAGGTAKIITCQHGSTFATCVECEARAGALLAHHDRTGQAVQSADPWH